MKRRFNYTGRQKLRHEDVVICLQQDGAGVFCQMDLRLDRYHFPVDAMLCVEAYRNFYKERHEFGRIGSLRRPIEFQLKNFPGTTAVRFRVKVVEPGGTGRILAHADGLVPRTPTEQQRAGLCLLPVRYSADLDGELWRLNWDNGEGPVLLEINAGVPDPESVVHRPEFRAAVFPEVLRQILRRAYEQGGQEDEEETWPSHWLRFAEEGLGVPPPPESAEEYEVEEWINEAVRKFCEKNSLLKKYSAAVAGERGEEQP
jgi:hypothetical protein